MTAISVALIDLDGTVYRGSSLLPGAKQAIEELENAGITPIFLSNNATKRPDTYQERLSELGIDVPRSHIINSAAVSAAYLAREHPDDGVYVVGESPLVAELEAAGVSVTTDPSETDVILASFDRTFHFEKLQDVLDADNDGGVTLLATNPDRTCPVENGEVPDAGAVIGAIERMLEREFDAILGKPSEITVSVALERADATPDACVMVGDRLETDVRMGTENGLTTALVTTGVTDRDELRERDLEPDYVLESIADLPTVLKE